jgi:hypothetical protein
LLITSAILAHIWQKIDVQWLLCHSWRDYDGRRITAMDISTAVISFLLLVAVVSYGAYLTVTVRGDGLNLRRSAPPTSHHHDMFDPASGHGRFT